MVGGAWRHTTAFYTWLETILIGLVRRVGWVLFFFKRKNSLLGLETFGEDLDSSKFGKKGGRSYRMRHSRLVVLGNKYHTVRTNTTVVDTRVFLQTMEGEWGLREYLVLWHNMVPSHHILRTTYCLSTRTREMISFWGGGNDSPNLSACTVVMVSLERSREREKERERERLLIIYSVLHEPGTVVSRSFGCIVCLKPFLMTIIELLIPNSHSTVSVSVRQ